MRRGDSLYSTFSRPPCVFAVPFEILRMRPFMTAERDALKRQYGNYLRLSRKYCSKLILWASISRSTPMSTSRKWEQSFRASARRSQWRMSRRSYMRNFAVGSTPSVLGQKRSMQPFQRKLEALVETPVSVKVEVCSSPKVEFTRVRSSIQRAKVQRCRVNCWRTRSISSYWWSRLRYWFGALIRPCGLT